jgi:hypothetical protein
MRRILIVIVSCTEEQRETFRVEHVSDSAFFLKVCPTCLRNATHTRMLVALHSLTSTNQLSRTYSSPCYPSFPRILNDIDDRHRDLVAHDMQVENTLPSFTPAEPFLAFLCLFPVIDCRSNNGVNVSIVGIRQ